MFTLIKRFPPLWPKQHTSGHVLGHIDSSQHAEIAVEAKKRYPDLAAEIDDLERELMPVFSKLDLAALHAQDRFRRQHVLLIVGAFVVTVLGGAQAAFGAKQAVPWIAVSQAALSVGLGGFATYVNRGAAQARYASHRLKAEALRREYFLYLAHAGLYVGSDGGRAAVLRGRVIEIETGEAKS